MKSPSAKSEELLEAYNTKLTLAPVYSSLVNCSDPLGSGRTFQPGTRIFHGSRNTIAGSVIPARHAGINAAIIPTPSSVAPAALATLCTAME